MIRQYPEVPAAVELADVSKHIMNAEFTFSDQCSTQPSWRWQSSVDFDPMLSIVVADVDLKVRRNGSFLIKESQLAILDDGSEYWLSVPTRTADQISNDPFIRDFVEAFRQYRHGRSELIIPS